MKRMFDKEEIVEIAKEEGGGGGQKLYLHVIALKMNNEWATHVNLYLPSDTPFASIADFASYLYSKNIRNNQTGIMANGINASSLDYSGRRIFYVASLFSTDGTKVYVLIKYSNLSTDGSSISITSGETTSSPYTDISDTVVEL